MPIEKTRDIKGYFIEGMTAIRSLAGTHAALKAMITNENLKNSHYKKALLNLDLPAKAQKLFEKNFEDEKRHLAAISKLAEKEWD